LPGAKDFLTLAFMQEFFAKYDQGENVALVPEDNEGDRGYSFATLREAVTNGIRSYPMVRSSTARG
jgi:hypothetical protein